MTDNKLRDAIAETMSAHFSDLLTPDGAATDEWTCADAILAMPEMQAIRKALLGMANAIADEWMHDGPADTLRRHHEMPEHVIDWAMEDQP